MEKEEIPNNKDQENNETLSEAENEKSADKIEEKEDLAEENFEKKNLRT